MKDVLLVATEHLDHTISAVEVTSPPCKRSRLEDDDLFGFMDSSTMPSDNRSSTATEETANYLFQQCTNFMHVSDGNHRMKTILAKKYLFIPATPGPVERLFSIARKVF